MTRLTIIAAIFLAALTITIQTTAQTTILGNTQSATSDFLGWNTGGLAQPLNIKTEQAQHINFYTNSGIGALNNQRMTIRGFNTIGGMGSNNTGWVGIGTVT